MQSPIENIGLVNIIDEVFDEYKGIDTPYEIETNATVLSFIKKIYAIIKDGSVFKNDTLLTAYKIAVNKVLLKLLQIENRKIYEYSIRVTAEVSAFDGFQTMINELWNYVDRKFPETLTKNEQKNGYYETIDGVTFFNGYRETISIGDNSLTPTYNEDDSVEYTSEKNEYLIKLIGIINGKPIIQLHVSGKTYNYFTVEDFINGFRINVLSKTITSNGKDVSLFTKYYNSTDGGVIVKFYFAFENGFVVSNNNEYENPNGKIYELFEAIKNNLEDENSNALKEYLKQYFYAGLVDRYREKKIEDKETSVHTEDLNFDQNSSVLPGVYERLNGRGGKIGVFKTLDFGTNTVSEVEEYQRLVFDESYYNVDTNKIELYINKNYLNNFLKTLSNYSGIAGDGSYLEALKTKYKNFNKYYDSFSANFINYLNEEKEIEEILLKELFFAVEPQFLPDDTTSKKGWNKEFFVNNISNFQKVYFYNNSSSLQEDNLLKNLNSVESGNLDYTKLKREMNLSISFEKNNLVIYLNNNNDIVFGKKYNSSNEYFSSLGIKKFYLGNGYINLKKVPQKFKDNKVSKLIDNEDTNKRENYESEEFGSLMDDREFITVYTTKAFLANVSGVGITNAEFNEEKQEWEEQKVPEYKKNCILYKKKHYYELDCSSFSEKNDINSITQIRVMSTENNLLRFLFNVRRYDKTYSNYDFNYVLADIVDPLDYNLSNILEEKIIIPETNITYKVKEEAATYIRTKYEEFKVDDENINVKYLIDDLNDKNYVVNTGSKKGETIEANTLIINSENSIYVDKKVADDTYTLYINGPVISNNVKKYSYKLILEKNLYTKQYEEFIPDNGLEVEILDFIQSDASTVTNEFKYYSYSYTNNENSIVENEWEKPNKKAKNYFKIKKDLQTNFDKIYFSLSTNNILNLRNFNKYFSLKKNLQKINFKKALNLLKNETLNLKIKNVDYLLIKKTYAVEEESKGENLGISLYNRLSNFETYTADSIETKFTKTAATNIKDFSIELTEKLYYPNFEFYEDTENILEINGNINFNGSLHEKKKLNEEKEIKINIDIDIPSFTLNANN